MVRSVFKNRGASILKKSMELSVLCGIRVCSVILDPDGKFQTWPDNQGEAVELLKEFKKMNLKGKKEQSIKKLDFSSFDDKLINGLSKESVIEISKLLNSKIEAARNRAQFLKMKMEKENNVTVIGNEGFQQISPSPNFNPSEMMLDFSPISRVPDLCQQQQLGGAIDLGNDWKNFNFEPEVVIDLPPPLSYLPAVDDNGGCSSSSIMAPIPQCDYFGSETASPFEEVLGLLQHSPLEADMLDMFDCGSPMATYPLQPMPPLDYCFS